MQFASIRSERCRNAFLTETYYLHFLYTLIFQVLNSTLFLALDKASYERVDEFNSFAWYGKSPSSGLNYGTKDYFGLMHSRTNIVLALLENKVSVFIGETDQVWQINPMKYVDKNFQGNLFVLLLITILVFN